ncbi:MAG: hypothetical protein WBL24_09520, partial [Kiritimatiellia bacterium]
IGSEGNGTASALGERSYSSAPGRRRSRVRTGTASALGERSYRIAWRGWRERLLGRSFCCMWEGPGEGKEGEGGGWGLPRVNRFKILVFGDYFIVIFGVFDRILMLIE